ncbi:AbrB family transcriptional regulator [Solidesulfovibrio alcoholivorans]|uniref:AbrB family transcriptional regulator n=1 Tax=Solidesulfovibrio alcoholivorans TaxID=81406 RepID=UPI0004952AEA|nr:AbrB family transcriptional regulator [Solidesulfovibrio alcoholivorans]
MTARSWPWLALTVATLFFTAGLWHLHLPAALLVGPMLAGIGVALSGGGISLPRPPYILAQAVVGCYISRAATPDIVPSFARGWPLFLAVVLATIAASGALGWLLYRHRVMPETTGIWGTSPGGATAMVVMAEANGADVRLVAFMQYLRVICVALAASLVAHFWQGGEPVWVEAVWFPAPVWDTTLPTLGLVALGAWVGLKTRIPSGAMLAPMFVGGALHLSGLAVADVPAWLLAATYAAIGWRIGLGFTRRVAFHAARSLPAILASILALMAFCGLLAWIVVRFAGVGALTAYLATCPGGMDTVAIIAATSPVDLSFVMTLQTVRFFLVTLLAPPMARFLAAKAARRA